MHDTPVLPAADGLAFPPLASVPVAPHRFLRRFAGALRRTGWHLLRQPWRLLGIAVLVGIIALGGSVAVRHVRAYSHFRTGRADLLRHHNRDALAHFRACLRIWPNDPDALLLAARACWRLKDFTQAGQYLRDYQQAVGATEDFTRESFLVMAAEGDIDKAEKYCQERIDHQDPATPVILEALVSGCMRQYRLGQAAAFLQHWLDLQPDDTQALLFQITLDHMQHHVDEAITRYYRVLQRDPEHDAARLRLAGTLLETRRYQEAIPHLEMLRQREPTNWEALVLLAMCQDYLGQPDAAEELLDRVLAQAPHTPTALAERGRLALRRGQLQAAECWLRQALVLTPDNFRARYNLGQCLLQQGEIAEMEKQQRLLKQLERDAKRLRRIITREMNQRPHDPTLHQELAMILLRNGDKAGALHWLHSALREDPTSVPLHRALAEFNQDIGNQERAAYHRQFVPPEPVSPPRPGS